MIKKIVFIISLSIIFISIAGVVISNNFASWENKHVANYYIKNALIETSSPNVVSSIVWDFRAFDTMGEETVLFAAAVGVFTMMMFGVKKKKRVK